MKPRTCIVAGYALAFLVVIPATILPLAMIDCSRRNTFVERPDWSVSKRALEMAVMGADSYCKGRQALAGNVLHLAAWHGYQEVMYGHKVNPLEVQFRFALEPNSYLLFIFGRDWLYDAPGGAYRALRFSRSIRKPSACLTISAEGEFLEKKALAIPGLTSDDWNDCRIVFGPSELQLQINRSAVLTVPAGATGKQYLGFRGGERRCDVDDIVVRQQDGAQTVEEHFGDWREVLANVPRMTPYVLAALVLTAVIAFVRTRRTQPTLVTTLWLGIAGMACAWLMLIFQSESIVARYPVVSPRLQQKERQFVDTHMDETRAQIEAGYAKDPAREIERVIFLGASQAWGAGATKRQDTFVARLEAMLNERFADGRRFQCLNAAVLGSNAMRMGPFYRDFLVQFEHKWLVMNFGVNDEGNDTLRENLLAIIRVAREHGVRPILCVEALSPEYAPDGPRRSEDIRAVARESDVPLIELHGALAERQDDGILWWDFVHMTSFGQRLVAEQLADFIASVMARGSTPPLG